MSFNVKAIVAGLLAVVASDQTAWAATYYRTGMGLSIQLSDKNVTYDVLTVSLPKGNWILTAKTEIYDGEGNYVSCILKEANALTPVDISQAGVARVAGNYYVIPNAAVIATTATSTPVNLACFQTENAAGANVYVQAATLVVQPAGAVR